MLRDETIDQEILLKVCNGFLLAGSPSPVCWSILVNSSCVCSFLCQGVFAHYGRGLLLNTPGQVTPLL